MITDENIEDIIKTAKSVKGLEKMLYEEIDKLRNGQANCKASNVIVRMAEAILKAVDIEIKAYSYPLSQDFCRLPDSPNLEG